MFGDNDGLLGCLDRFLQRSEVRHHGRRRKEGRVLLPCPRQMLAGLAVRDRDLARHALAGRR
ncbi:hypothetical protein GCM10020001_050270 [Nonomuraea salmonea]